MGIVPSDKLFLRKGEYGTIECRLFTFLERMKTHKIIQDRSKWIRKVFSFVPRIIVPMVMKWN